MPHFKENILLGPGHEPIELFRSRLFAEFRQLGKQVQEITVNVEVIELCRLNDRIPHHAFVSALVGIGENSVLPAHDEWLHSTLEAECRTV